MSLALYYSQLVLLMDIAKTKTGEPFDFSQFSARVNSASESSNFFEDLSHLKNLEFKSALKPLKSLP